MDFEDVKQLRLWQEISKWSPDKSGNLFSPFLSAFQELEVLHGYRQILMSSFLQGDCLNGAPESLQQVTYATQLKTMNRKDENSGKWILLIERSKYLLLIHCIPLKGESHRFTWHSAVNKAWPPAPMQPEAGYIISLSFSFPIWKTRLCPLCWTDKTIIISDKICVSFLSDSNLLLLFMLPLLAL